MLKFTSLGGAGTVTGSKHLLDHDGKRILVDCGLFQGLKNLRELNWESLPIAPSSIDAVVLTHAHLDHSGYLPKLVRDGFQGKIFATDATHDVAKLILRDSGFLQEKDAEYANRKGFSKHKPALPLYGVRDAERALERFSSVRFDEPMQLPGGATLRFRHAGHIMGAATADIEWGGKRIVFSGDLGRYDDPVMPDPVLVPEADYIVVESTYGNRTHQKGDPTEMLGSVIDRTVQRGGTVVIPAFAVGRAQSLLYHLWQLKQAGRLASIPIFLDSPMSISATDLLHTHRADHRLSPEVCDAVCAIATYTRDVEASKAITASTYPKVVISASGMATGGRVLHHLKAFAPDQKNTILFSGFQAAGTRGRAMLQGAREIKIHGQWIPVQAEIADLPALSAHADSDELMRWLSGFRHAPARTFIVHGEPEASEALRVRIGRELEWKATVPRQDQAFDL
ncbi:MULTISPECIES: MBL fold metallo-hydrolase RNA specificity domain-containing protein [Hyphomicrobiales]|uniref:MBL fold metallo-hydrolase RNA specificity domain-containing protein n=1 Tax=Hyphomicrobiales TaxID=356 RepID=UPI0002D911C4|nr:MULTISPECIES: MBL fold metallo-hydrolase [Hyphomicrobiales]ALA17766.1 mRNA 3'-end processing factor [Chelatococcus sp. CO-6]MBC7138584.1 MBL fold metallo-hydrolase [Defluviimonas sp.]NIJ43184.1 metallo-beta-lactamase family protein [Parvibaculum indicum]